MIVCVRSERDFRQVARGGAHRLASSPEHLPAKSCIVPQTASPARLRAWLSDRYFRKEVDELLHSKREAMKGPAWFQRVRGDARLGGAVPLEAERILWQR